MNRLTAAFLICIFFLSCKRDALDMMSLRNGQFEIPAGKGYSKTLITRNDSLQIESYESRIDSFRIFWKDSFNYTLEMITPRTAIDEEPIHVKITDVKQNSYEFEAVIGHSNYIQKGTVNKIK